MEFSVGLNIHQEIAAGSDEYLLDAFLMSLNCQN
jgi:hypothetical protein